MRNSEAELKYRRATAKQQSKAKHTCGVRSTAAQRVSMNVLHTMRCSVEAQRTLYELLLSLAQGQLSHHE
jgi:hypothetical protein